MSRLQTKALSYRVSSFIGKSVIKVLEFFITLTVKKEIYLLPSDFSWTQKIEHDFLKIKNEYDAFFTDNKIALDICDISEEQYSVVNKNEWDFIPLYFYGTEIKYFTAYFPQTKSILQHIPNMTTAFFSILKPGTFIKEHRGAYKGYLRYQIGIQIPQPEEQCALEIEGKTYHWQQGKSVIFDDTYLHSAWNHSSETRTVLYVDFIRPMHPILKYISILLTKSINRSPFVQNGISNLENKLKKQTAQ